MILALVGDVKVSEYITWAGDIARGKKDVDSIFLQSYNVASDWPRVWTWTGLRGSMCCVGLFITVRTIGNSAGESKRVCRKPVLQLIILHPSLLCNVTHYHIPWVSQSHRIIEWKEIQRGSCQIL